MITPSRRAANHKGQLGANPCLPPEGNASTYIILLAAAAAGAGQASQHGDLQGECMATTSDHDVLITAGRRMVEGRPCAEGGSRGPVLPVVRARHPCPSMSEPMPSASELLHHSMIRMVRRTTAMAGCAGLLCRFEILQGLAQYCLGQSSSPRSRN